MWTVSDTRFHEPEERVYQTTAEAIFEVAMAHADPEIVSATDGQRTITWVANENWINDGGSSEPDPTSMEGRWRLVDSSSGVVLRKIRTWEIIALIATNKVHEANNPGVEVWAEEDGTNRRLYWDNTNDWIKVDG